MDPSDLDDLLKTARSADKVDKARADAFEGLVRHPGWPVFVEILNAKLQGLSDVLIAPSRSVDGMVALEYVKGAMSGLMIARDLPHITIAAMKQLKREQSLGSQTGDDDDDSDLDD